MIGPSWTVPHEAVRDAADTSGAAVLASLATKAAKFQPHARVEVTPAGFVAHIVYQLPPYTGHHGTATVPLRWPVWENAAPASPFTLPVASQNAASAEVGR